MVFKIRFERGVVHTRYRIFSGTDIEHLAYCGFICMKNEEWEEFRILLEGKDDVIIESTSSFWEDGDTEENSLLVE